MTTAQTVFWDQAFAKLIDTEEWKKELETNFWSTDYMRSTDMRKLLERENTELRTFLTDLGLVK